MTDGGCASSSRPLDREADLLDAYAAGQGAQRVAHAAYLDAYADRLGTIHDPETVATIRPILAGLATTIRAGIADSEGDPT